MAKRKRGRRSQSLEARMARAIRRALEQQGIPVHKVHISPAGRLVIVAKRQYHRRITATLAWAVKRRLVGDAGHADMLSGVLMEFPTSSALTWDERLGLYMRPTG